ncbi:MULTISPECIES: SapB/AmfS family lanthipeptide [Streptomyces]|nr:MULTISPECIES: SapB/AmfS family lanthipeptide [Streptomyces]UBI37097.1 hypothetical protein K7I03_11915 [Streptomyces mobaraensis]UKW29693.1 hypothetical protein MCU78_11890 [Streptomyces sp. TYQ1024]
MLLDLQVLEAEWDARAGRPGEEPEAASVLDSALSLLLCH